MPGFRYNNVCLVSMGYTIPSEIVSSAEIEAQLSPIYERLRLPAGRLELMTGIRERRFWREGWRPSQASILSCQAALEAADFDRRHVGCLVHGSVCRDFLEPATASGVHHGVGLDPHCLIYDVSNACLGVLNGMLHIANMIELGQIQAGLVVGSEGGRQLVENTIKYLNNDTSITRKSIKPAVASLTIGSASCGVLLAHRSISQHHPRLTHANVMANTAYHHLCQSDQDQAGSNMAPLMDTDSELLLQQGVLTGKQNFASFLANTGWRTDDIHHTICHQVGVAHQRLMLEALDLDLQRDFVTYPWLGNTGSAALPVTLAVAAEQGFLNEGANTALLGIGSGINCVSIALEWKPIAVRGQVID
ncbi:MAG TPA: 3-oxoacyl-ACP synthase III [Pirellulaceae bacterium]|nr:3-oxoacyl-ACP synthase III [Pirellulaceae bacterium]HMO92574.1 3-oxoacyl-ACP synthase III [Pirellulaceae bacterium]HMP70628.1 3-oxoacyl-ACP synthase III [Pirellulaceae bacterium]